MKRILAMASAGALVCLTVQPALAGVISHTLELNALTTLADFEAPSFDDDNGVRALTAVSIDVAGSLAAHFEILNPSDKPAVPFGSAHFGVNLSVEGMSGPIFRGFDAEIASLLVPAHDAVAINLNGEFAQSVQFANAEVLELFRAGSHVLLAFGPTGVIGVASPFNIESVGITLSGTAVLRYEFAQIPSPAGSAALVIGALMGFRRRH